MDNKILSVEELKTCLLMIKNFPEPIKSYIVKFWENYHHPNDLTIMSDFIYMDLTPEKLCKFLCGAKLIFLDDEEYKIKWLNFSNLQQDLDEYCNKRYHYYSDFFHHCHFGSQYYHGQRCSWIQLTRAYPSWYNIYGQIYYMFNRLFYGLNMVDYGSGNNSPEEITDFTGIMVGPYGISRHTADNPLVIDKFQPSTLLDSISATNNIWLNMYRGFTATQGLNSNTEFMGFTLTPNHNNINALYN